MASTFSDDPSIPFIDPTERPIEIKVGQYESSVFVHGSLIKKHSKFFDTALKKEWKEGTEAVMTLPDEPDVVCAYIKWLYTRRLFNTFTEYADGTPALTSLARLYVFGEKLLDNDFQDHVLNAFVAPYRKTHWVPDDLSINIIYDGTPKSSPARRMLVNMYTADGHAEFVGNHDGGCWDVPEDFKDALIAALLANRMFAGSRQKDFHALEMGTVCVYHKHGEGGACTLPEM